MGIQAAQLYGNILVMLQGLVRTDNYVISTLLIKDIQVSLEHTEVKNNPGQRNAQAGFSGWNYGCKGSGSTKGAKC